MQYKIQFNHGEGAMYLNTDSAQEAYEAAGLLMNRPGDVTIISAVPTGEDETPARKIKKVLELLETAYTAATRNEEELNTVEIISSLKEAIDSIKGSPIEEPALAEELELETV